MVAPSFDFHSDSSRVASLNPLSWSFMLVTGWAENCATGEMQISG